jgi:hypothetical protein
MHGAMRIPRGGDFSELPMGDPHYRPAMDAAGTVRFLRDAQCRMTFCGVDRDAYVSEFGWEQWNIQRGREMLSFHEAQQLISEALREVRRFDGGGGGDPGGAGGE